MDEEKWKKFIDDESGYSVDCGERHFVIKKEFEFNTENLPTMEYPSPTIDPLEKK